MKMVTPTGEILYGSIVSDLGFYDMVRFHVTGSFCTKRGIITYKESQQYYWLTYRRNIS